MTIYAMPGMGFYSEGGRDLSVDGLHILKRPGSGRLMSTSADGINFAWTQGAVQINSCELEGMGDDGMNLHAGWVAVTSADTATSTLQTTIRGQSTYVVFATGDQAEIANDSLQYQGTATIQSATINGNNQTLVLDSLPAGIAAGWVVANASRVPDSVNITDSTVRGNRGRGILIQSRNVLLDGCTFANDTAAAIHVTTDINTWFEGPSSSNVTISNCILDGVNKGAVSGAAALWVFRRIAERNAVRWRGCPHRRAPRHHHPEQSDQEHA